MSNLKNTYGFSSSLLDAIRSVHETSNQDVEQIDEISKEAKKQYIDKAVDDLTTRAYKHGFKTAGPYKRHSSEIAAAERNIKNRQVGISRATKEEVELDEAVPYTLGGRPDKSNVYKVHRQDWKGNWSHNPGDTYHSLDDAKTVANNMRNGARSTVKTKITKHARPKLAGPKGVLPEEVEQIDEISRYSDNEETGRRMKGPSFPPLPGKPLTPPKPPKFIPPGFPVRKPTSTALYKKEEVELDEQAPTYNVVHPKHGVVGIHSADGGFKPTKPHLGFKPGKTIPDGTRIDRTERISSTRGNSMTRLAGPKGVLPEEVDLEEGGMPSSVIRSKQKYAAMTNQEFADLHGHKTENELRQMAWSHGYGKMSPHYWNRVQKAKATPMKEEVEQLEEAQNLIPLISQLKALLSWLVSSGAIRKFAKEEADIVGMLELLEYRTPGSKNGQRKERKSTGAARGRPKNSDSMQSKSNENEELDSAPAYDSASRDTKEGFRHVLTDIQNAADSSTGGTVVQDKQKQRHLPQKTAQQLLNIFRTAKPAVNAELSGHIFANREIPLRSPHHIAAYKAMKGAGEITSLPNGRGRPANEQ